MLSLATLCLAVLLAGPGCEPSAPAVSTPPLPPAQTVAARPLVIRKLHLVRPDLLKYPLHYEVIC